MATQTVGDVIGLSLVLLLVFLARYEDWKTDREIRRVEKAAAALRKEVR
jgi:hypothetical protein